MKIIFEDYEFVTYHKITEMKIRTSGRKGACQSTVFSGRHN
jgi:hypothetical protein